MAVLGLMRSVVIIGICLTELVLLSGCSGLVAGAVVAIVLSGEDSSSNEVPDGSRPSVTFVGTPRPDDEKGPDAIHIAFKVRGEDSARLDANLAIQRLKVDDHFRLVTDGGQALPEGGRLVVAEELPREIIREVSDHEIEVSFPWDAKVTLGDESAMVVARVTPREGGATGTTESSVPFRAGNSPVTLANLKLSSNGTVLTAGFDLVDRESDRVPCDENHMGVGLHLHREETCPNGSDGVADGGKPDFAEIPLEYIGRQEFLSAPGNGAQGSFSLDLAMAKLPDELASARAPGFYSELTLQLRIKDLSHEESATETASFLMDNNEPPWVEILPIPEYALASGVIPIHYRLYDNEQNTADVSVKVDLEGDGQFVDAKEFPASPSEGTVALCTLDPQGEASVDASQQCGRSSVHTFLWDAAIQTQGEKRATISVTATDRETGSSSQETLVGLSSPSLHRVVDIRVGGGPSSNAKGDFNGDGIEDVVVVNQESDSMTFLEGTVLGLLRSHATEIDLGQVPGPLTVCDFDGNQRLDLVVLNLGTGTLTCLSGSSQGLAPTGNAEIPVGKKPLSITSGHFDNDRYSDIVVVNQLGSVRDSVRGSVTYLRGSATGLDTPLKPEEAEISVGENPRTLIAGDFNGDGTEDVVVANGDSNNVTFLQGTETGLARSQDSEIDVEGEGPGDLAKGDFDGNGILDLVVANRDSNNVTFFLGTPNGPVLGGTVAVGEWPIVIQAGLFNKDELEDVVVLNWASDSVSVLHGSVGGLVRVDEISVGDRPNSARTGDFNGDGSTDIVIRNSGSSSVTVLLQSTVGELVDGGEIAVGDRPGAIERADFDGDGRADIVVANRNSDDISYLKGTPQGLRRAGEIPVGNRPVALNAGDFNGDGRTDLVVVNELSEDVSYLQPTRVPLQRVQDVSVGARPRAIATGDLDGDGVSDVVTANKLTNDITFLRGSSRGMTRDREIAVGRGPIDMATGDFNGDGLLDLAVANEGSDDISYFLGTCEGPRQELSIDIDDVRTPWRLAAGDFNGDDRSDLVLVNKGSNNVSVLLGSNREDEVLAWVDNISVGDTPGEIAAGDFDGDGSAEFVVSNQGSDSLTVLNWTQDGPEAEELNIGEEPLNMAVGDFDGNGISDIVVAYAKAKNITYLLGTRGGLVLGGDTKIGDAYEPRLLTSGDFDGDGLQDVISVSSWTSEARLIRWRGERLRANEARERVGLDARDIASGDFDGDGVLDIVILNSLNILDYVTWTGGRLELIDNIPLGHGSVLMGSGDFDGDGFLDLAGVSDFSDTVTFLRQRYFIPHVNMIWNPGADTSQPKVLVDPRDPPRYRLVLESQETRCDTGARIPVCIVPSTPFALPQGEAHEREKRLTIATDTVRILPETSTVSKRSSLRSENGNVAFLTLRVRDTLAAFLSVIPFEQLRFRVYRLDPTTQEGAEVSVATENLVLDSRFREGKGLTIPVEQFGAYLIALEHDR